MSRKRNPESSVINVLDKAEMIEEDEYFEGTGLETDNISNIMRTQGVTTVETSSVSAFFDHHDEDEEDQDGNDISVPRGISARGKVLPTSGAPPEPAAITCPTLMPLGAMI